MIDAALACLLLAAAPLQLENRFYRVNWDAGQGTFAVSAQATGKVVLTGGKFAASGGSAVVEAVTDKTFGAGSALRISYPDGGRDTLTLYPDLPFVLVGSVRHNGGRDPVVLNHLPTVSVGVELGQPASALRTLGTAGLRAPDKQPGSYAFLAVADPDSRAGVVAGWLTHDRGSGVVFSALDGERVRLDARLDYGRLRVLPGQDAALETLALGWFADARFGLEAYADALAKVYAIKLPRQPAGLCTWYMDKYSGASDEKHLAELSALAAKELKPFGFDFVQIDDHWQAGVSKNGPKRNFTTHAPAGPYPSGMKPTAEAIAKLGLTPGIWFMPFAGTWYDPYFADHQDWFAKGSDGKPFETAWGGTCLDMTQPGAREHLRSEVKRIGGEWGYTFFKMDGLWTGTATKQIYVNDGYKDDLIGETTFANPDKTNVEAYRDGLKLVREAAGPGVYLLGCCVSQNMRSFGGAFGLLDGMRVGPDTGGRIGAPHGSRLWFLHNRVWHNDPDCVFVRKSLPLGEALTNASWAAISGQLFYDSDWLPDLPPDRLDILKRCMPAHGLPARPVDVFEAEPARLWLLTDTRTAGARRDVVALYNWGKSPLTVGCPATRLGLPPAPAYVAFDFWANAFVPPFKDQLSANLAGQTCRVLAIRPVADHPQLLSTSRHITQGMVDVVDERWDAGARTLSGTSHAVAGDRTELRVIVPTGAASWRVTAFAADDLKAEFTQDGPKIRAWFTSPTSRDVAWRVRFEPAAIEAPAPRPVTELKAAAEFFDVTLTWSGSGADGYRVTRGDGTTFESATPGFTDTTMPHGQAVRYDVVALGWGGAASPATTITVTTPAALRRPAKPPLPSVYLGDLKPVSLKSGWGTPGVDKSVQGRPLTVGGQTYTHGLGLHSPALAVYAIPPGAQRFVAVVGLDGEVAKDERASVVFEVWGDVQEMGEAPVLVARSPLLSDRTLREWAFDAELNSRFKQLRLVITEGGDDNKADHADWVDAGFVVKK